MPESLNDLLDQMALKMADLEDYRVAVRSTRNSLAEHRRQMRNLKRRIERLIPLNAGRGLVEAVGRPKVSI